MAEIKRWESKVYLEPIEHVYIHKDTGVKYNSVTKVISSIEEHFDEESVAMAIVRQDDSRKKEEYIGMTKDDILKRWKEINTEANIYGTKIHNTIEDYLMSNKTMVGRDELECQVIDAYNRVGVDEGDVMYPEKIMFSEEYELAGMSDLVVTHLKSNTFSILDYKTNRKFNFYSPFGKWLLAPFDYLSECQYSVYTIQLSTYALMMEMETGMKCRDMTVLYWDRETLSLNKVPIMYMKNEAQKLLNLHKYKQQLEKSASND